MWHWWNTDVALCLEAPALELDFSSKLVSRLNSSGNITRKDTIEMSKKTQSQFMFRTIISPFTNNIMYLHILNIFSFVFFF